MRHIQGNKQNIILFASVEYILALSLSLQM